MTKSRWSISCLVLLACCSLLTSAEPSPAKPQLFDQAAFPYISGSIDPSLQHKRTTLSGGTLLWPSSISAASQHTCAISSGGTSKPTVYCWGKLHIKQNWNDNKVTLWPTTVSPITNDASIISALDTHGCAISIEGGLYCWGRNDLETWRCTQANNDCGSVWYGPKAVKGSYVWSDVSVGEEHVCALKLGGKGWCWGSNSEGQLASSTGAGLASELVPILGGHTWLQLSAGAFHSCGLSAEKKVWCWGSNRYLQSGVDAQQVAVTQPTKVRFLPASLVQISSGHYHTCALDDSQQAWCWGRNSTNGKVGRLGSLHMRPTSDEAYQASPPQLVQGGYKWKQISCGAYHTCGITTDGIAMCFGDNSEGQLGSNSFSGSVKPVAVHGGKWDWTQISAGKEHTCALDKFGHVYCWGANDFGQLGDGTRQRSIVPVLVLEAPPKSIVARAMDVCVFLLCAGIILLKVWWGLFILWAFTSRARVLYPIALLKYAILAVLTGIVVVGYFQWASLRRYILYAAIEQLVVGLMVAYKYHKYSRKKK